MVTVIYIIQLFTVIIYYYVRAISMTNYYMFVVASGSVMCKDFTIQALYGTIVFIRVHSYISLWRNHLNLMASSCLLIKVSPFKQEFFTIKKQLSVVIVTLWFLTFQHSIKPSLMLCIELFLSTRP